MKRLITTLIIFCALLVPNLAALPASAVSPKEAVCNGVGLTISGGGCGDSGAQVSATISNVINLLLIVVGVIAVIVIIVAGLNFITSGGDSNKVTAAKNTIVYAIIGLVVVAFAEVIVHFVISTAKG